MIKLSGTTPMDWFAPLRYLISAYVLSVVATVVTLAVLSALDSVEATTEAWVHALIMAVFSFLLPVRVRAARRGSRGALRATGLIASVLVLANAITAILPWAFPVWMRCQMVAVAVLMAAVVVCVSIQAATGRKGNSVL